MKTEIPSLSYNAMFKAVFSNNTKLFSKLVEAIIDYCNLDIDIKGKEITLNQNELPISNYHDRQLICDYLIKLDDNYILNIEINRSYYNGLSERNLTYSFKIYYEHFKSGDKKTTFSTFNLLQVNFNGYNNPNDKTINRYFLIDADDMSNRLSNNYGIINIDIEKCHELIYNKTNLDGISDLEVWGAIIACKYLEDIASILERGLMSMSKEEKSELLNNVNNAAQDKEMIEMMRLESSIESKFAYIRDMEREYTRKAVTKELNHKHEVEINNMILEMLNEGLSYEKIKTITGKSIEEIKSLENKQK